MIRAENLNSLIAELDKRGYQASMLSDAAIRYKKVCEKKKEADTDWRKNISEASMVEHYISGVMYGLIVTGVIDAITYANVWNDMRGEWEKCSVQ